MWRADLKLGFACNNRCRHCVVGDKRTRFRPKTLETIRGEIVEARRGGCEQLVLTGGEPTIRKDIVDIVRAARESGFRSIQIQTNGRMLSDESFCSRMIDAGANSFVVGFHGHTSEIHEFLTASRKSFAQSVMGIRNLIRSGQYVAANVVVTKPNYRNLPQIARLLLKLGVAQFQFAFVHPLGTAWENFYSIVPRMSLIEPYVKEGLDIGRIGKLSVMTEAIPYCFMRGYEEFVGEQFIPPTTVFDADHVVENYGAQRVGDGKAKAPMCSECERHAICEGPWREYPERYGWAEFIPVKEMRN